ncbi:FixH family protein [Candidatus Microthrix parvicella]|uniref:FixH family protein n=1 Tax=Candidatus Neomicrothrix parvicella TaxID=41950 RepID=UPI00036D286B|nr:FixH family protein [Candidatus Microthrix parvicella]
MFTRPLRGVLLIVVSICSLVGLAGPASAHGPEGTFTPIVNQPVEGQLAARLRVTLIYDNDAEPVDDATVQVTPTAPDGTAGVQATLTKAPEPGTYEGVVPVGAPGAWTFAIASEDPEASTEIAVTIPEPAPATTAVPATTPAPVPSAVATSLVEPGAVGSATTAVNFGGAATKPSTDQDSGFPWGIAVIVAVVAAGAVMIMAYAMRSGDTDGDDEDDPMGGIENDGDEATLG